MKTRLKLLDDIKLDLLTTSTKVKHLGSKHYTIDVTLVVTLLLRQQHLVSTALTFTVLLSQLISTRGGEHNSTDEKLNKHLSTLQHGLFIANQNKHNVAKYTHHTNYL